MFCFCHPVQTVGVFGIFLCLSCVYGVVPLLFAELVSAATCPCPSLSLSLPHSTHVQRFKDGKGERVRERELKLLLGAKKGEKTNIFYIYLIHFIVVSRPVAFCRTLRIWLSLHYASRFYFIIIYIFLPLSLLPCYPFLFASCVCVCSSLLSEHIPLSVIFPAIYIYVFYAFIQILMPYTTTTKMGFTYLIWSAVCGKFAFFTWLVKNPRFQRVFIFRLCLE